MINVNTFFYHLSIYSDTVSLFDYFKLASYTTFKGSKPMLFSTQKGLTSYIDLKMSEDELLSLMKSNYRNEIRKAINLEVVCDIEEDIMRFVEYYNDFASKRGLGMISRNHITKYRNFLITKAVCKDVILTYHAYIMDEDNKIVRLLYSASNRFDESIDTKLIGYSNKYLHYCDYITFKYKGFILYDFAGVCDNPSDKEKYGIGLFKKGFGGKLVDTYTYNSPLMTLALKIKK
ncbi:MAG: hypothetical protein ACI38V_04265 [Bacteroides sp.]